MINKRKKKKKFIIISSPSGAGKSSICKLIIQNNPNIKLSISATTRKARPEEVNGRDYFFLTQNEYNYKKENGDFVEYAKIFGNYYGTPKKMIDDEIDKGNMVLFDIDWQGAQKLYQKFYKDEILSIFILPPSMEELKLRLSKRAGDSDEIVEKRMKEAKNEILHQNEYDYSFINDNLNKTFGEIQDLINSI